MNLYTILLIAVPLIIGVVTLVVGYVGVNFYLAEVHSPDDQPR